MKAETVLFKKFLNKFWKYLKVVGLCIDENDFKRNFKERLVRRWFFSINFFFYIIVVFFEIVWFINGIIIGRTLNELTYVFPCFTICLLGSLKMVSFLYYAHHVNDIIMTLRRLQSQNQREDHLNEQTGISKTLKFLNFTVNCLGIINFLAPISFGSCTLTIMLLNYLETQQIELILPFYILYPFNAYDLRVYPFIFLHQIWCGFFAVFGVLGPDCFFYTSATFIYIQLCSLQNKITEIKTNELIDVNMWRPKLNSLVEKHRQLIRCISMLEAIFSKSTLFNVVTSSFMLCLAGFNIMSGKDVVTIFSFTTFFVMGLVQIFIFCYFGDMPSASVSITSNKHFLILTLGLLVTVACSNAVYNSKWYIANVAVRKDLLIILTRSQKPCKLTACGFMDVDLRAFATIMSAAWSYFALLSTMYRDLSQ